MQNIILNNKSIRDFQEKDISKEHKELILKACFNAPTAGNMQLYSIIDITDKIILNELSILCDNQDFINKSKMCLVFLFDKTKWIKMYKKFNKNEAKITLADYFLGFSDALAACQNAVCMAGALQIGSCYIGDICENYEKTKELLKLKDDVLPVGMLVFGYPSINALKVKKPKRFNEKYMVFENEYKDLSEDEIEEYFKEKITNPNLGVDLDKKLSNYIDSYYNRKENTPFFKEMNRSLYIMLHKYFKDYKENE